MLHYSYSDLDSGQEGIEAQEKVTYSRTSGRKRRKLAMRGEDFFIDGRLDEKSIVLPVVSSDKEYKIPKLVVLHQNICSLRGEKK
jgi:hypothetical protein